MAEKPLFVDFWPGNFMVGVDGLSAETVGVYIILLCKYWTTAGKLSDDDQTNARTCNVSTYKFRKIKSELIERGKLIVEGGYLVNARAESTLENIQKKREENSERGKAGADARWGRIKKDEKKSEKSSEKNEKKIDLFSHQTAENSQSHDATSNAIQIQSKDISSIVSNSESSSERERHTSTCPKSISDESSSSRNSYPQEFEDLWKLYARKNDSKHKAYQSWLKATKDTDPDQIKRAASAYIASLEPEKRHGSFQAMLTTWLNQQRYLDDYVPFGTTSITAAPTSVTDIPETEKPFAAAVEAFRSMGAISFPLWSKYHHNLWPSGFRQQLEAAGFTGSEDQILRMN